MVAQLTLLDPTDYGKVKKKRVHYKNPKRKVYRNDVTISGEVIDDINDWDKLKRLYENIANYFPLPLFEEKKECYDFEYVRVWVTKYKKKKYKWRGQEFTGEDFIITEAEIKGTENLCIEQRLYIHELVYQRLLNCDSEPFKDIHKIIEDAKNGKK